MMKFGRYLSILLCLASSAASALTIEISNGEGMPISNAVVTLSLDRADATAPNASSNKVSIQQIARSFSPKVSVIAAGQEVFFPNNDDVLHHVYSFSPTKTFEFALYGKDESPGVTFDKTGLVVLGCNIHDRMRGYVYVTDAPYFAVSDDSGRVELTPAKLDSFPQSYGINIWHPEQKSQEPVTETIVVNDQSASEAIFEFSLDIQAQHEGEFDEHEAGDYE